MNQSKLNIVSLGLVFAFTCLLAGSATAVGSPFDGSGNPDKILLGQMLFFDKEISGAGHVPGDLACRDGR